MRRKQGPLANGVVAVEVHTAPHEFSGWHHHGEYTTCGFVIDGQLRFEFGPGGRESVELAAGDFFLVPPRTVHREGNPGSREQVAVAVRMGTGQTIFNVEGPDRE
jgi:uncharacterized RmlC-like cupin family protein